MKLHPLPSPARRAGNVLLAVLCLALVLGVGLAAVFRYTTNQARAITRSQSWNESLVVADAGVEDALQLLNKYADTTEDPMAWTTTAANDNWTALGGNIFRVNRSFGQNAYEVYITNTSPHPWIRATGTRIANGAGGSDDVSRTILVQATTASLFQGALLAKNGVTLGGTVRVDSYNSQNPLYSTNGRYDPAKARDKGSVATVVSNMVAAVTVGGSVDIFGRIYTGPGDTIKLNGGATVGSLAWHNGANSGLETGWSQSDLNVEIPDAPAPPGGGLPLPTQTANTFEGTSYPNSFLLSGTTYSTGSAVSLSSTERILVTGHVKLHLTHSLKMAGQSQILIASNSSLTIYAAGDVDLSGGGVVNGSNLASNLTVFGLNTCANIKYSGGSSFTGTIYAPYAEFSMTGGGNTIYNLSGSVVAKTIKVNGKYEIHYDESLRRQPAGPIYYVMSWAEL
jgi:hypothetical protein